MMTDVQVSNARRIIFTVLALTAFVWISFAAYSQVWRDPEPRHYMPPFNPWSQFARDSARLVGFLTSAALLPTIFLSLSHHNSPLKLRDPWIVISGVMFSCTIWISHELGDVYYSGVSPLICSPPRSTIFDDVILPIQRASWLWLLPPIILTTAFVIFGAWRRGVREQTG